jgi:hypothetical protein
MDAAVEHLRRVNDALAPLEHVVEWRPEDTSFEAVQRIEAQVREIIQEMSQEPRAGQRPRLVARALDPVQDARRAVLHLSCAGVVGGALTVAIFEALGLPTSGFLLHGSLAAAGVALALRTSSLPRWVSLAIFSVECFSALIAGWNGTDAHAASGRLFVPFTAAKVVALLVAILSPSPLLGAGLIGLAAMLPVLQVSLWSAEVRSRMALGEPLLTVVIGVAALGLLVARRRSMTAAQEVTRIHAERAWLERVARLSLAIRHFTSAPLQTLRVEMPRVRRELGDAASLVDRMDKAVARIVRLSEVLTPLDAVVALRPEDTTLNATSLLEQAVREHLAGREPGHA